MLLKDLKVLDLSTLLPGPMCSLFLADLAAEVIKVESLQGDPMRRFEITKGKSPYFLALNRNKKSIALNLKSQEGKKIFMKLAKNADVIIEGFRPGKVDGLGVGYKNVRIINPKIVYCSITGYGQKGRYKNKAGHDLNYASLSGMLDIMSEKPFVPGVQIADIGAALTAAFAIMSALLYKEKHGKGTYIDIAVLDTALSIISMHIAHHSLSKTRNKTLWGHKICYNIYETKDKKFVSLGAIETKFWRAFCSASKRKDLLSMQFDGSKSAINEMGRLFKSKTLQEWVDLGKKFDFCCEPVKKLDDVIASDYFKKRGLVIELDNVKQVGTPIVFSSIKKCKYSKSPKLGQHTIEILKGIGYNNKMIQELKSKEVI